MDKNYFTEMGITVESVLRDNKDFFYLDELGRILGFLRNVIIYDANMNKYIIFSNRGLTLCEDNYLDQFEYKIKIDDKLLTYTLRRFIVHHKEFFINEKIRTQINLSNIKTYYNDNSNVVKNNDKNTKTNSLQNMDQIINTNITNRIK